MSDKKQLNDEELENVNGGKEGHNFYVKCSKCGNSYSDITCQEKRTGGSGCDSYTEYKCPECGTFNRN